ncbi:MAG: DoxX family protein [Aquabacterium sp.]|jgi:putative oxidoreductase|nr:MAG: DoxX family protein [Aquabacterium sp.]
MNTTPLSPPTLAARLIALARLPIGWVEHLQPLAQLAARLYIAGVFFRSGRTKIADWDTTLALFENEYHVPLLPPDIAAWMGTGGELGLSVLLALGLAGRFSAAGLSVLNVVAVLSLAEINEAALLGHQFWGSLLLALLLWGPGKLSLDNLVLRWLGLPPRHRT